MQTGHVIWDWNGTLLDDVEACVAALNGICKPRGIGPVSVDQYLEGFRFPVQQYYVDLGFDFEQEDWNAISIDYHKFYREFSPSCPLREGAREALEMLRERGISMSIVSASESGLLKRMVEERGVTEFFDDLCGLDNLYAASKVDVARSMLERRELDPSAAVFIGDTLHDWEVAEAIGCGCVLVAGGHQSAQRLAECGDEPAVDIAGAVKRIA